MTPASFGPPNPPNPPNPPVDLTNQPPNLAKPMVARLQQAEDLARGLWTWFGSSSLVGILGLMGFGLATWKEPLVQNFVFGYKMDLKGPETVNFWCEGSEAVDQASDKSPSCGGTSRVVLIANPLTYRNDSSGDLAVLLIKELVDIDFLNEKGEIVKRVTLTSERVEPADTFQPVTVEQIEAKKILSHNTLFYPQADGCSQGTPRDCVERNSFKWLDFVTAAESGSISRVLFTFRPTLQPPIDKTVACEWEFGATELKNLKDWRNYPYIAANCIASEIKSHKKM